MPDVVIPYLRTESSELRYCLRAIAKNVEHNNVIIVGDRPPDYVRGVFSFHVKQGKNRYDNVRRNYEAVPEWVSDAYLFNDDYFVMSDAPIELHHTGRLNPGHPMKAACKAAGMDWYNYEGHFPLRPVNWPQFIKDIRDIPTPLLRWMRTWHCNMWPREATKINDAKIVSNRQVANLGTRQFVSTSEHSWAGHAGRYIRSVFSEPGRYDYPDP